MNILCVVVGPGEAAMWRRVIKIADILDKNGHNVKIHQYTGGGGKDVSSKPYNLDIYEHSLLGIHLNQYSQTDPNKFDFVIGHTHMGTFAALSNKLREIPVVFDVHGGAIEEHWLKHDGVMDKLSSQYIFTKLMDLTNFYISDVSLCVSNSMIEYFDDTKPLKNNQLRYVTNGVNISNFESNEHDIKQKQSDLNIDGELTFGYVGGNQHWQGLDELVEAARSTSVNCKFLLVGGDKDQVDNNIIFKSKVEFEEVPVYYGACDVLVLPRPSHPATEIAAPTKFSEYLAASKPVLSTDVGDAARHIENNNAGYVVNSNSVDDLCSGFEYFANQSDDEIIEMANNAKQLAEDEFSMGKMEDDLLSAISSIN